MEITSILFQVSLNATSYERTVTDPLNGELIGFALASLHLLGIRRTIIPVINLVPVRGRVASL